MDLTDAQWAVIKALLPPERLRKDGRGRPWKDTRAVFNGVLWILRTGSPWMDMPERYPPYQICHRRFQAWSRDGTLINVLQALAKDLRDRGRIDLSECFIDGTFVPAKKGVFASEKLSGARGQRSWQLQTVLVFLSRCTWPALARMKSNSSKLRLNVGSLKKFPNA